LTRESAPGDFGGWREALPLRLPSAQVRNAASMNTATISFFYSAVEKDSLIAVL